MAEPNTSQNLDNAQNSDEGMDDKLDVVFKALSDMQIAIKDLATAVSSGQEAQRGYEETLNTIKSFIEAKKVDVGMEAAAAASQAGDKLGKPAGGEPPKAEGAEDVNASPEKFEEPGAETLQGEGGVTKMVKEKDIVKSKSPEPDVVTGNREGVEVRKAVFGVNPVDDLIKDILKGNVKTAEAGRRAMKIIKGGS